MVLKQRGGIHRRLIMIASAGGSIADLARGLWRCESGKRWLVPLAVFLCIFGVDADLRDDGRSARAIHLRDLLTT